MHYVRCFGKYLKKAFFKFEISIFCSCSSSFSNAGILIMCIAGFKGDSCEIDYNECDRGYCTNNSTCIDLPGDYTCICPAGFTGKLEIRLFMPLLFQSAVFQFNYIPLFKVQIHSKYAPL